MILGQSWGETEAQRGNMEGTDAIYLDGRYPGKVRRVFGFILDRRPLWARHKNGERHTPGTGVWGTDISRLG